MTNNKRILLILAVVIIGAADCLLAASQEIETYIRQHKAFWYLKAVCVEGEIKLTFYKTKWFYNKPEYDDLFKNIRIYRKEVNPEFSEIAVCSDKDIIYNGSVKLEDRKFTYYDKTAAIGKTYVYWVAANRGEPVGRYAVKIKDPNVWWSQEKISREIYNLQKAHPKLVKVSVIGKSVKGSDILGVVVGKSKKKIALVGAIHPSESGPELIIPAIKNLLEEHKEIFVKVSIVAIPCINPDSRQLAAQGAPLYIRQNAAGVDLNRNFPAGWQEVSLRAGFNSADPDAETYRGKSPASEPEIKAAMAFIKAHRPSVLLSYHFLASVTGRNLYAPAVAVKDDDYKEKCRQICKIYSNGYCSNNSDEDANKIYIEYAATPGSLPLWCYKELNIPAFDVERHAGLEKALTYDTDIELLTENQKYHTSALLNLLKNIKD